MTTTWRSHAEQMGPNQPIWGLLSCKEFKSWGFLDTFHIEGLLGSADTDLSSVSGELGAFVILSQGSVGPSACLSFLGFPR